MPNWNLTNFISLNTEYLAEAVMSTKHHQKGHVSFRLHGYGGGGFLYSPSYNHWWKVGINRAGCKAMKYIIGSPYPTDSSYYNHTAPSEECSCGFYGSNDLENIEFDIQNTHSFYIPVLVEGFGKIIIHKGGVRMEYARIMAIIQPPNYAYPFHDLRACAEKYNVSFIHHRQALEILKPYAQTYIV